MLLLSNFTLETFARLTTPKLHFLLSTVGSFLIMADNEKFYFNTLPNLQWVLSIIHRNAHFWSQI